MLEYSSRKSSLEFIIISGLLLVQVRIWSYMVFLNQILSLKFNALFLIIFGGLATSIFLLPFAVALEKKKWPTELRPILMAEIFLICLGMALFQGLILMGIKLTSPAIASAMPNLAPGFIFLIAAWLRYKKFVVSCCYTRAKVIGTLVCLSGALAMSLFQSQSNMPKDTSNVLDNVSINDWILGCFYLLSGPGCYPLLQHCLAGGYYDEVSSTSLFVCDNLYRWLLNHCNTPVHCGRQNHSWFYPYYWHKMHYGLCAHGRSVNWHMCCIPDLVHNQKGPSPGFYLQPHPDSVHGHSFRHILTTTHQFRKPSRNSAHVWWSLHSTVGKEQ